MMPQARPDASPERVDPSWAWARYTPSPQCPWTHEHAAHLWRRAGFGAAWRQLARSVTDGPQPTVDRLLKPEADVAAFTRSFDRYENAAGKMVALRAWWLRRMIETPDPLGEKLTLMWHDLFAARTGDVELMRAHVGRLRAGATGRWDELVAGVGRDPAVLLSLGAEANRKASPTDRFARQLLDRHTVGPGNYSPRDVSEAARAMTGWFVRRGQLRFVEREHDGGTKTFLGKAGNLTASDVVKIAATHPAAARNVVRTLYRWLISEVEPPTDPLIAPLAESFAKDFDLRRLVETILRSNLFFSDHSIGQRVKRPVEFAIGIARALESNVPTLPLATALAALGESLYAPPTVHGWTGGRHWITAATLIGRSNLAAALLSASGAYGGKLDPVAVARRYGQSGPKAAGEFLVRLFATGIADAASLDLHALVGSRSARKSGGASPLVGKGDLSSRLRVLVHTLVTRPEFQLA